MKVNVTALREFLANLKAQFDGAPALLGDGPLKAVLGEVQSTLAGALEGLPKEAEVEQLSLDPFTKSLAGTTQLCGSLVARISELQTLLAQATAPDKLQAAIDAALKQRTEAGELVPKATVEQLCLAARTAGKTEGRSEYEAELAAVNAAAKLEGERRESLTKAGLPLPDLAVVEVLRASEEDFGKAKTLAEQRLADLTQAGLEVGELANMAWAPEKDWNTFRKTVAGITALKKAKGPAAEPLAGGVPAPGAAPTIMLV